MSTFFFEQAVFQQHLGQQFLALTRLGVDRPELVAGRFAKNGALYWSLIRRIGEQRWAWLERVIAHNGSYPMGLHEWLIVEIDLKQQLAGYAEAA